MPDFYPNFLNNVGRGFTPADKISVGYAWDGMVENAQTNSQSGQGTAYPSADFSQKLIFSKTFSLNYLTYFAIKNNIYLVNFPAFNCGF